MKFDFEKFPALRYITKSFDAKEHSFSECFPIWTPDVGRILGLIFTDFSGHFRSNINYVTDPIIDAVNNVRNSFRKNNLHHVFFEENKMVSGTILIRDLCCFYYFEEIGMSIEGDLVTFATFRKMVFVVFVKSELKTVFARFTHVNNLGIEMPFCGKYQHEQFSSDDSILFQLFLFNYLVWKKYAPTETKIILSDKKIKHSPKHPPKKINQTPFNIQIITSTWFVNLIKGNEFKVNGHWRLQPYGNNEKRLIWISEFKKTGYTRVAKIAGSTNSTTYIKI